MPAEWKIPSDNFVVINCLKLLSFARRHEGHEIDQLIKS